MKNSSSPAPSHFKTWAYFLLIVLVGVATLIPVFLLALVSGMFRLASRLVNRACQSVAARFFRVFEFTCVGLGFSKGEPA